MTRNMESTDHMTRLLTSGIAAGMFLLGIVGAEIAHAKEKISLKDAHQGTLAIDLALLNASGKLPEEIAAFYEAARSALCGERPQEKLAAVCRQFGRQKIGGPMLGNVTENRVKVWMHLPEPCTIRVVLKPEPRRWKFSSSFWGRHTCWRQTITFGEIL